MTRRPLEIVGVLESCFKEKFCTPRQPRLVPGSTARLKVRAEWIPAQSLKGLDGFSHLWLISYFHLNTNKRFKSTVHPPRLQGKGIGVFASRAPHRPSALGLSLARLVKVEGDTLHLAELDLVDGTPIVDIKPYIPSYDVAKGARVGWVDKAAARLLRVKFSPEAEETLRLLGRHGLRELIAQSLRQDPRNPRDRSQHAPGKVLEFFLFDYDVQFSVKGRTLTVVGVVPAAPYKKERRPPPLPF